MSVLSFNRGGLSMGIAKVLVLVAGAMLALSSFAMAPDALARGPFEAFIRDPVTLPPAISPSGRYLAVSTTPDHRGTATVRVYDLQNPSAPSTGTNSPPEFRMDWVQWASDDRLLLGLTQVTRTYALRKGPGDFEFIGNSRVVAVDRDGSHPVKLFSNLSSLKRASDLTGVLHLLPKDPDHILMEAVDEYGYSNVYRVNVKDGAAEKILAGKRGTFAWLPDLAGNIRIRWDGDWVTEQVDVLARVGDTDNWTPITQYSLSDLPELKIIGFGDDPATAIVASRSAGDKFGVYEYNVASRSLGRLLFQAPNIDVGLPLGGPIYDPRTQKLVGVTYVDDVQFTHYFDPVLAKIQDKLEAMFSSEAQVAMLSWSDDRKRIVVGTSGPKNPGAYYLCDLTTGQVSPIGQVNGSLPAAELGETTVINYTARDGSKVPGYLTLPPGKGNKGLPMVVMPHGGPETRDYVQFDHWVQFLANRGYAVFQPNFRGSGGYGRAFTEQGYRQYGRRMQDDITDGLKALIADGTADPKRVCIVGASYGGYAALAGGAFTPELYKCVISIAGVSDLELKMHDVKIGAGRDSFAYRYWKKWLGDLDTPADLDQMRAASPAFHAENFTAPVLLIHGDADTVVRWNQSNRMDKALSKAGKKSRLVLLEGERHPEFSWDGEKRLLTELEAFLAENIGN
jgi:dipeptidyl aminopeptidase/acylaminoacyl peptidase